jgi:hypothetical protein
MTRAGTRVKTETPAAQALPRGLLDIGVLLKRTQGCKRQ